MSASQVASLITYNGVSIVDCTINSFKTDAVYAEDGITLIGYRRTLDVTGIVHNTTVSAWSDNVATNINAALVLPRQTLTVQFDGSSTVTMYTVTAAGGGLSTSDVSNGPIPESVNVTNVAGGMFCFVQFVISWTNSASATATILSHRWTQRFTVGEDDFQVRLVEGTIIFATRATLTDLNDPDAWRMHVIPPYIAGFKREVMDFAVDETGTKLKYMIRDTEMYRKPPGGALVADGSYSGELIGAVMTKTLIIKLKGSRHQLKGQLIAGAFSAMKARLNLIATPNGPSLDMIQYLRVDEELFRGNEITLTIRAIGPATDDTMMARNFNLNKALETYSSFAQSVTFTQPSPYGSAVIKAAAQYIFNQTTYQAITVSDYGPYPSGIPKAAIADASSINGVTNVSGTGNGVVTQGGVPTSGASPVGGDSIAQSPPQNFYNPNAIPTLPVTQLQVDSAGFYDQFLLAPPSPAGHLSQVQQSSQFYTQIHQTTTYSIENAMLTLQPAAINVAGEVQQTAMPRIVFRSIGYLERVGAPPVLPETPPGLYDNNGNRVGTVRSYQIVPMQPKMAASGSRLVFGTGYTSEVVVTPSDATATGGYFSSTTVSGVGTFVTASLGAGTGSDGSAGSSRGYQYPVVPSLPGYYNKNETASGDLAFNPTSGNSHGGAQLASNMPTGFSV